MADDTATPGTGTAVSVSRTSKATWGGFLFLDRDSLLINEDGSTDELDPELASALLSVFDSTTEQSLKAFLDELIPDLDIGSMEDLDADSLKELLQGTLDSA